MSRTRIVKGTYTKISGGGHSMYSKGSINSTAGKQVTENGSSNGVLYNNPKSPKKIEKIYDIVMFVAGTTDPVNTTGEKHQANTNYWRNKDKNNEDSKINFWAKIKNLKPQFLNLHIEGEFFSWSGDNDTKERNLAAERLLDVMMRTYRYWKNQEVHLHLIGHSHGGNVINQFSELITSKEMIAKSEILKKNKVTDFPKPWKIKSITYLSTPFFQKKHQLNHAKLHAKCQIINVHNSYDLTQQLIADFSLVNLEGLLKSFAIDKFDAGIKTLKNVDTDAVTKYLKSFIWQDFENRGIKAWREMAKAFQGFNYIISEFINYINSIKVEHSSLQKEKGLLINLLKNLLQWTYDVHKNYSNNSGKHDKATWAKNLNLTQGLKVLNILLAIKSNPKDSYFLSLMANIFGENRGITDSIDETSWTPKKQTKALPILDVPIYNKDPYHSRGKKNKFDPFLKSTQNALHSKNLEDMLLHLFSQFIKPTGLKNIIDYIDDAEYVIYGDLDAQLKILRGNLEKYDVYISKYYADLVTVKDETEIKDLGSRPGSIPYLATASHSLSHTQFWKKVETGLKSSFSSGKNPKYYKD